MEKKIIGIAVGVIVCMTLLGSLLLPVISAVQSNNSLTYTNEGVTYSDDPGDFTLYNTSNSEWVFNDETVEFSSTGYILISDAVMLWKSNSSGTYTMVVGIDGVVDDGGDIGSVMFKFEYVESTGTITFTKYTDLTGATVDSTATYTCTSIVVLDPDGDYVSVDSTDSPYVNSIDQVYSGARYSSDNVTTCFFAQGEDVTLGVETHTATASATLVSVSDSDIYQLSDYTVTITDGTNTDTVTPSMFVPATVTGHTSAQESQNAMLGVVGTVAVVVVAITAILAYSRVGNE